MDNNNLYLNIIDEAIDDRSSPEEGFVIDNDSKAEWAIKKIAEERAETQRYVDTCQSMVTEYQEKIRKAQESGKNKTAFLESQLNTYFQGVKRKITKTQETYKLPAGTLRLKYQSPEFVRDETQLINWLKNNSMNNLIKVEEKPNWAELKKSVKVSGETVVTEDGQIVEGVKAVERPPVFEVDV